MEGVAAEGEAQKTSLDTDYIIIGAEHFDFFYEPSLVIVDVGLLWLTHVYYHEGITLTPFDSLGALTN